jgi:integrase
LLGLDRRRICRSRTTIDHRVIFFQIDGEKFGVGLELRALLDRAVQSASARATKFVSRIILAAGLSPQTVVHYHRVLKQALAIAVRWGDLSRNPSDLIDPPRVERKPPAIMDESAVFDMLAKLAGNRVQIPAMLAVATGMRRGEILAVRWSDVDIERGMLSITRSLEQAGKEIRFKDTKSRRGRRQIALPEFAIEALRRHKAAQNEIRLRTGNWYKNHDLVVYCPNGAPWKPNLLTPAWGQALASRKIPHIRFHDLRHGHASYLLRLGVHPKIVSERLGHSTVGITLDTYSHVMPGMPENAARRLHDALSAPGFARDLQNADEPAVVGLPGRPRKPVKWPLPRIRSNGRSLRLVPLPVFKLCLLRVAAFRPVSLSGVVSRIMAHYVFSGLVAYR